MITMLVIIWILGGVVSALAVRTAVQRQRRGGIKFLGYILSFIFWPAVFVYLFFRSKIKKAERRRQQKEREVDYADKLRVLKMIGIEERTDRDHILRDIKYITSSKLMDRTGKIESMIHDLGEISGLQGFEINDETRKQIFLSFLDANTHPLDNMVSLTKRLLEIFSDVSDKDRIDWLIRYCSALSFGGYSSIADAQINSKGERLVLKNSFHAEGGAYGAKKPIALLHDGKTIAFQAGDQIKLYNDDGECVRTICNKIVGQGMQVSAQAQRIAIRSDPHLYIYDIVNDKEVAHFDIFEVAHWNYYEGRVAKDTKMFTISQDGNSILTCIASTLEVTDISTGERRRTVLPINLFPYQIQPLTKDRIVIMHDKNYFIYNYKTSEVQRTIKYPLHESAGEFLGHSVEGTKILICSEREVKIIDVDDCDHIETIKSPLVGEKFSVSYSSSTKTLVAGSEFGYVHIRRFESILEMSRSKKSFTYRSLER